MPFILSMLLGSLIYLIFYHDLALGKALLTWFIVIWIVLITDKIIETNTKINELSGSTCVQE